MDYIKFFNEKIKEKLEQDQAFIFSSNSLNAIDDEIKEMREKYPNVFGKDMSFEQLIFDSRSFEQLYDERQDRYDEYDYKISQNFFDKEAIANYERAKTNAMEYFDELGKFLQVYSHQKLEKMAQSRVENKKVCNACIDRNIKEVIIHHISSAELTALINDVIKGVEPANGHGYGDYGKNMIDTVKAEYKSMMENKESRKIQDEIERIFNKDENEL